MDLEKTGQKMENLGQNMQQLGCLLTMIITIPLLLIIFLGPVGVVISIVIVALGVGGYANKRKQARLAREAGEEESK